MSGLLDSLSSISTVVILAIFAVHLFAFGLLWGWARRDLRQIVSALDEFTRGLKHRSILDARSRLSDQIDAFLADVNDVLEAPNRRDDRSQLQNRINVLDERRQYLNSLRFDTAYTICRTMIEAYPLAGVLGTILAIGAALQQGVGAGETSSVGLIVGRFGDAIWSTFAGLLAAIVLMFVNSIVEATFQRMSENRAHVRETVAHAKRELSSSAEGAA